MTTPGASALSSSPNALIVSGLFSQPRKNTERELPLLVEVEEGVYSSAAGPGGAASKQPNQVRSDTEEKPSRSASLKSSAFHTYGENTTGEEQTAGAAATAAASSSFFFFRSISASARCLITVQPSST